MNVKKLHADLRGPKRITHDAGFTLIELMIAMVIFGLVIAGVVGAFWEQLRSHNTQQQILAMQQNARAAMYFITTEMRMAGFNPTGASDAGLMPDAAVRTTTTFAMDLSGGANDGLDNNGDGNDDESTESSDYVTYDIVNNQITRTDGFGVTQILADNIEVLDFVYHGVNPADPTDTNFRFDTAGAAANPNNIRSVNITIIARIPVVMTISYQAEDDNEYRNIDGDMVLNMNLAPDNFRRIMLQKSVKLRNMGLS
jgi:type IV pilus assembly protein PilW